MIRTASAQWKGGLKDGNGTVSTESGVLNGANYNFAKRFENEKGTNPEELVGAAHSACYSITLSLELSKAGLSLEQVDTKAAVTLEQQGGGFAVTKVHLTVVAKVPGATADQFAKAAQDTKANCPISKLLRAEISLDARLA